MSGKAVGWVFDHSPFKGDQLVVHLAMADVANDMNDNLLWMTQSRLAKKARCSTDTVARTTRRLIEGGLAELVEKGGGRGKPDTIRLICKTPHRADLSEEGNPRTDDAKTPQPSPENPAAIQPAPITNEKNVRNGSSASSTLAKATDDPVKKAARTLTVLALEQPVKPVLRDSEKNPFGAVFTIIERLLRAGISVQAVKRAIEAGIEVWTVAGIQTAIAHANPRARSRPQSDGDERSLEEIVAAAVQSEGGV